MCALALNNSASCAATVVEATQCFARELLGESVQDLGKLDEDELASILDGASSLVKQALAALYQAEVERARSQAVADYIVEVLMTEAWLKIRCRNEWKQVEAQVEKWAKERRCQSKRSKRKPKERASPLDSGNACRPNSSVTIVLFQWRHQCVPDLSQAQRFRTSSASA